MFYFLLYLTCSQIWLIPFVDDDGQNSGYITKLKKKETLSMMGLQQLLEFSNWSSIMIGPCSLLLVVSHLLFAAAVLRVGLEKSKELNLDVRNVFAGSDTGDALLR
jgi:hypothetical protein